MRWLVVFLAACGAPTVEPAATGPSLAGNLAAPELVSPAVGSDDLVVATVAGKPVWGSCVAGQLARGAASRQAALDECIDFELLAQAAGRYASDREVIEETRRALVGRVVDVAFEDRYKTPADVADRIEQAFAGAPMDRPELRASVFLRVNVPDHAPADVERRARELADRIYAELANETGLFPSHLQDVATRLSQGTGFTPDVKSYRPVARNGATVKPYEDALFGIPDVGRVSPVVRTKWGWDIVMLSELIEAKHFTREEVMPIVFARVRQQLFQEWVDGLERGSKIAMNEQLLDAMEAPR